MRAYGGELHRGSHHLPGRAGQAVLARGQRVLARPDAPYGRRSGSQTRAAGPSGTAWIVGTLALMSRFQLLSDAQWSLIATFLPPGPASNYTNAAAEPMLDLQE
jgi:hypothetical protein